MAAHEDAEAMKEMMQLLEAEPGTAPPAGLTDLVAPGVSDIHAKREQLAILVSTGKTKEVIGVQLTHEQVKRLTDKEVEKFSKRQKDRTKLLDWVAEQDREKNKAFHDFQDTDAALALYNQTHQAKVALPKEPQFSDHYKPSPQQKNSELLFIGASTLALGYAAFRFL